MIRTSNRNGIYASTPKQTSLSYANYGGTGHRAGLIDVTTDASVTGKISSIILGIAADHGAFFSGGESGKNVHFDFKVARAINEITWYQDSTGTHGTWKVQGSPDDASWTDLGGTFTLGSPATQVITTLSANTTAYRYYRLLQTAGTTSSSPFLDQVEFKIGNEVLKGYFGSPAVGDRSATITVSGGISGTSAGFVNGTYAHDSFFTGSSDVVFDLGSGAVVNECQWYQDTNDTHGTCQWQGSNDNISYTNIGGTFTPGGGVATYVANGFNLFPNRQTTLNGNTTSYRYYRLHRTAGSWSTGPFITEVEFSTG